MTDPIVQVARLGIVERRDAIITVNRYVYTIFRSVREGNGIDVCTVLERLGRFGFAKSSGEIDNDIVQEFHMNITNTVHYF